MRREEAIAPLQALRQEAITAILELGEKSERWDRLQKQEAQAQAVKEVVAWQLAQAMKEKKISKNRMATLLKTSRTQVDRLLDAKNDITLSSLQRAAAMVGRRVSIQLV